MTSPDAEATWAARLGVAWSTLGDATAPAFVAEIERIVADPAVPPPRRAFELACAHDSTGRSDLAIPLYCEALAKGIGGYERRRAVIQMASSLRNVGRPPIGTRTS
jgi:hypothetical protein